MNSNKLVQNKEIFDNLRIIANPLRFHILELTQDRELSITELSSLLKLSYTKCADYVKMLEEPNLISKKKFGKEVKVSSNVKFLNNKILFL
jgi:predicted transcriptional regulator